VGSPTGESWVQVCNRLDDQVQVLIWTIFESYKYKVKELTKRKNEPTCGGKQEEGDHEMGFIS